MPIYQNQRQITIVNLIFGTDPEASERIGNISFELLTWLRFKYEAIQAEAQHPTAPDDSDNSTKSGQSTQSTQQESIKYLDAKRVKAHINKRFTNPDTNDWNQRCLLAAMRSYGTQPLSYDTGQLTIYGRELAELANNFMNHHARDLVHQTDENSGNSGISALLAGSIIPVEWNTADKVIASGNMTLRQALMLQLLQKATKEAEAENRVELDEQFQKDLKAQLAEQKSPLPDNSDDQYQPPHLGQFSDLLATSEAQLDLPQPFQAVNLYAGDGTRKAFVPTSIFGDKARNDLKNLIKYGLVDVKRQLTPGRGRPRHIVRVSPTGAIVIKDLSARGII